MWQSRPRACILRDGAAHTKNSLNTYMAESGGRSFLNGLKMGSQPRGFGKKLGPTVPGLDWQLIATGHADADPAQNNPAGAAEHALVHVLLQQADLPNLQGNNRRNRASLHDEARDWLNRLIRENPAESVDLTNVWPNWRAYIAMHKMAGDLVGPGVIAFTAEFIEGTRDGNRMGMMRMDMIIRHTNGGYVRIHPGGKIKDDATPKFVPPAGAANGATEHARTEWNTPGPGGTLTWERAQTVPQGDRLGKKAVWEILQGVESPWLMPKDITDGSILRWWLWICNLGAHSKDVIGPGVTEARVSMTDDWMSATFTFERADGSSRQVVLSRGRHQELNIHVP